MSSRKRMMGGRLRQQLEMFRPAAVALLPVTFSAKGPEAARVSNPDIQPIEHLYSLV